MATPSTLLAPATRLFSPEEWNAMYPEAEYKKTPTLERVRELPLHYMLGINYTDDIVIPLIHSLAEKNPKQLIAPDPKCDGLTPLHIAVMRNRIATVEALVLHILKLFPKELNRPDAHGWTPPHHATIRSAKIADYLLAKGADQKAVTHLGASLNSLKILSSPSPKVTSLTKSFFQDQNKKLTPLAHWTDQDWLTQTGLKHYHDEIVYTSEGLKKYWRQSPEEFPLLTPNSFYAVGWKEYLKKPTSLVISQISNLATAADRLWGLFSNQDLDSGTLIGNYSGIDSANTTTFTSHDELFNDTTLSDYKLNSIDAQELGDLTRFANFGFPNMSLGRVVINGIPYNLMVANQSIKKGEQLLWNYGAGLEKLTLATRVKLFEREKIERFFQKGLKEVLIQAKELYEQANNNIKSNLRSQSFHLKTYFPLSFPLALLDLHFKGVVPAQDWFKELDFFNTDRGLESPIKCFSDEYLASAWSIRSLLIEIMSLEAKLKERPLDRKLLTTWFLEHLETYSVVQHVKAMNLIKDRLNQLPSNTRLTESDLTYLEKTLSSYDWNADPDGPFHFKTLVRDVITSYKLYSNNDAKKCALQIMYNLELIKNIPGANTCEKIRAIREAGEFFKKEAGFKTASEKTPLG